MPCILVLGEENKKETDAEQALIEKKIQELGKIIKQQGSQELLDQVQELRDVANIAEPGQDGVSGQKPKVVPEAVQMQRQRIKAIEKSIDYRVQRREEGVSPAQKVKMIEEGFSPEKKKALGESLDKERVRQGYYCCRAVLENNINVCNKLSDKEAIKACEERFKLSLFAGFLDEITKHKQVTPKAQVLYRQLSNSASIEECELIAKACLSGKISLATISAMPTFEGWQLAAMGLISGNPEYCNDAQSAVEMQNCKNFAAYNAAIKAGNPESCQDIKDDPLLRKICQLYFSKDKELCDEFLKD